MLLETRAKEIFAQIVETYLQSGKPIASRDLALASPAQLSPATIRNVMKGLERLGLIFAPHVSAGRLPTQKGLRFFVNTIIEATPLDEKDKKNIEKQLQETRRVDGVEQLLNDATELLSKISQSASLVVTQKTASKLQQIEFLKIDEERALVVLVNEKGEVENRIIPLPPGNITHAQLSQAANYLNWHIQNKDLKQLKKTMASLRAQAQADLDELSRKLVEAGLAIWSTEVPQKIDRLIIRGRSNLLQDLQHQEDLERTRLLFDDLETQDTIAQLLSLAEDAQGIRIFIGSENRLFSLSGSAFIIAPCFDQNQQIIGALGVIGPTRLNYARIVPVINYTAQLISEIL